MTKALTPLLSADSSNFKDRASKSEIMYNDIAENISGQQTAAMMVKDWIANPKTRYTVGECKYTETGVGAAKSAKGSIYWA